MIKGKGGRGNEYERKAKNKKKRNGIRGRKRKTGEGRKYERRKTILIKRREER